MVEILPSIAAASGIACAAIILLQRRFGRATWLLALALLAGAAAGGTAIAADRFEQIADEDLLRAAYASLLFFAFFGVTFTWTVDRPGFAKAIRGTWILFGILAAGAPVVASLLFLLTTAPDAPVEITRGFLALGPGGYIASLYLIVSSVLGLAGMEQIVRTADEKARWEIKFLILGLGAAFAAVLYVASKVLLYPFSYALLPLDALNVFTFIFPVSCLLIFLSWKRSSGRSTVTMSQSFVYSSVTLLAVGIYLIVSSLLARWMSQWGEPGIRTEALVFLLSILALGVVLFTTQFRHRAQSWIRRHLLAGRYDYRHHWMEAAEKIRSVDDSRKAAIALARIVQGALGAIDISVWLRAPNPDRLVLLGHLGNLDHPAQTEIHGVIEPLTRLDGPFPIEKLDEIRGSEGLRELTTRTNAALLVPLISSDRLVGLMTVGSDRSGRPFGWEAREFLSVLAHHAAGELHKAELLETLVESREAEAFRSFSTFLLHDLKNFASTLSLIAKNATRHQEKLEFQKDAFKSVYDTAEKMKRLCNSLNTFSGTLAANKKMTDLNDVVRSVANSLNAGLGSRLSLELAELPKIKLDVEEMERVIQNLLLNADEAISADGRITIATTDRDDSVELSVKDDGRGMTPEFLEKDIFFPFRTTRSDGLGIGLFQCKKIVEAHGGTIRAESELGRGTFIRIELPKDKTATGNAVHARAKPAPVDVPARLGTA